MPLYARRFWASVGPSFVQGGAALNPASRHGHGLLGLFSPEAASGHIGRTASNARFDIENLAAGSYGGIETQQYHVRSANAVGDKGPEIVTDGYGLVSWRFEAGVGGPIPLAPLTMPWRPVDNGGHAPGTLMFVGRLTGSTGGIQSAIGFSANGGNYFFVGFSNASAYGQINTNTARQFTSSALTVGHPLCVVFTTRAHNDHELISRNLITGAQTTNVGTLSSGTAGTLPAHYRLGGNVGIGGVHIMSQGQVYLAAFWARAMTNAEMVELARDPFALLMRAPLFRVRRYSEITFSGALEAVTEDCVLVAEAKQPLLGLFDATAGDCVLDSAAVQLGDAVLGLFGVVTEDCVLDAAASVRIVGELDALTEDCMLASVGIAGSLGPFPRRPFLVLN